MAEQTKSRNLIRRIADFCIYSQTQAFVSGGATLLTIVRVDDERYLAAIPSALVAIAAAGFAKHSYNRERHQEYK